jgi:putative membrane protein
MISFISHILKGALMGAANVIPGVSGGTMALLTGIFERLINAIKSFNITALQLLLKRDIKGLLAHIDFAFLFAVGIGVLGSILTVARLLETLFETHGTLVWAFFFGLILASVYFVGRKIKKKGISALLFFVIGTIVAAAIAFLEPATENSSISYLLLCGVIAMCSMILPGLSGSYVLLLMGNYQLIMITAINDLRLDILIPVGIGAVMGLMLFARLLSWILSRFHDQTLALLTGFIFGSLAILWPWKTAQLKTFADGDIIKEKVIGYSYQLPELNTETALAIGLMILGMVIIAVTELLAGNKKG